MVTTRSEFAKRHGAKSPTGAAIQHVPGTPEYEALSYTWGSAHSRRAIIVEDPALNTRTKLLVTKSLAIALHHLRYRDRARALWVDAICINQQDMAERNAQVQRMPHVYRLAHRVVVWLGPGSRQSRLAMSTLGYLGGHVQVTRQNHLVRMPGAAEWDWYGPMSDLPYDDETWRSILRPAGAHIEHFGRLDALRGCIDTGMERITAAPSWVPDLILPPPSSESIRQQFSAGMSRTVARYADPGILEVAGVRAGPVTAVQGEASQRLGDGLELVRGWGPGDLQRPYPGGGSLLDALAMTICGMKVVERLPWLPRLPTLEEWKTYCQEVVVDGEEPPGEMGRVNGLYISAVESVLYKRRFYSTAEGHIGLGPEGMESGTNWRRHCRGAVGYSAPMVLRESPNGTYIVIGEGMVYGFHDATCILGSLPKPWIAQVFLDSTGVTSLYRFFNPEAGQLTDEDPRLEPLQGWERLDADRTADDPEIFQKFRNLSTGEVINYDPRMSLDALKSRGLVTSTFCLS
ncbi:hypothetical protein ACO1O0_001956 [Amphichorda felina]